MVKLCNPTSVFKSNNLSPQQIRALDELMHAEDLVIKTADKGVGIVLQSKSDYIREADRLLSDQATYIKLGKDPTTLFVEICRNFDSYCPIRQHHH